MKKNKKALQNKDSIKKIHNSIVTQNMKKFILFDTLKCPISPMTGLRCTRSLSEHATSFGKALNAIKRVKNAIGIGLVLGESPLGNIACVDIDNCIQNGEINSQAKDIMQLFQSYTEISQSGKGLHIIFIANKSGNRCKNNNTDWCKTLELYSKNDRYIALTFKKIGSYMVENRQSECYALYEKYFTSLESKKDFKKKDFSLSPNLEKGLKVDKKLIQYWYGNMQTLDESSNDMGLMSKLVYWCGYDVDLAIWSFMQSPYAAQKDQLHYKKMLRRDYLLRTAQKCLQGVN